MYLFERVFWMNPLKVSFPSAQHHLFSCSQSCALPVSVLAFSSPAKYTQLGRRGKMRQKPLKCAFLMWRLVQTRPSP